MSGVPNLQRVQSTDRYEAFRTQMDQLVCLASMADQSFGDLELKDPESRTKMLMGKLAEDSFKVMVLGEFKRGKSTFINALLGVDLLPSYAVPCTAVINEIRWGIRKSATLHFCCPLPEKLPKEIPAAVREHLKRRSSQSEPAAPLEIATDELESFVTIPFPEKDQAESVAESPYQKVEIEWPLDLCKRGVEIIDSPGLNEHKSRTLIAKDYIGKVDAIIFVLSCTALGGNLEMQVIERDLIESGHDHLFFVCNRFDEIRSEERERIRRFGMSKLSSYTRLDEGVFFMSARQALDGRLRGEGELVQRSGIAALEEALTSFLTNDRGRVKLLQPARDLQRLLFEVRHEEIPKRTELLNHNLSQLEEDYEKVKPDLEMAERTRDQVLNSLKSHAKLLSEEVYLRARGKLKEIADAIPEWAEALEVENRFKLFGSDSKEKLVSEVTQKFKGRIDEDLQKWQQSCLKPLAEQRVEQITRDIRSRVEQFYAKVAETNAVLTSDMKVEGDVVEEASGAERFFAALAGASLNPGLGVHGYRHGFHGMLPALLTQVATAAALYFVIGITNPLIVFPLVWSAGIFHGKLRTESLTEKAKKEIGKRIAEQLRNNLSESASKISREFEKQTDMMAELAKRSLDAEIDGIRQRVEAVLEVKRKGEADVEKQRKKIEDAAIRLVEIDKQLTEFLLLHTSS